MDEMRGVAGRQAVRQGRQGGLSGASVEEPRRTDEQKAEGNGAGDHRGMRQRDWHEHKGKNEENAKQQHHEIIVLDAIDLALKWWRDQVDIGSG